MTYFVAINVWRLRSRSDSVTIFWLWFTAPIVSILLLLVSLGILLTDPVTWRH